jgi:hypothetical protein
MAAFAPDVTAISTIRSAAIPTRLPPQWVRGVSEGVERNAAIRYDNQRRAPRSSNSNPPAGSEFVLDQPYSMDTRLSAFGAFTVGLTVGKAFADGWSIDLRADFYRQQSNWRIGGGSPGLLPFSARWFIAGVTKNF